MLKVVNHKGEKTNNKNNKYTYLLLHKNKFPSPGISTMSLMYIMSLFLFNHYSYFHNIHKLFIQSYTCIVLIYSVRGRVPYQFRPYKFRPRILYYLLCLYSYVNIRVFKTKPVYIDNIYLFKHVSSCTYHLNSHTELI